MVAENRKKPRGKPFAPGNSANPGGRPKKTEEERNLEQMCRAKTVDAFGVIVDIMSSGAQEKNRLSAAQYVIDRGWGKAPTTMTINGNLAITEMTPEERAARLAALEAALGRR